MNSSKGSLLCRRTIDRPPQCHNLYSDQASPLMPLVDLAYCFDMLSMGVGTTRHWQMSGQQVHELNVCTCIVLYVLLTVLCIVQNHSKYEIKQNKSYTTRNIYKLNKIRTKKWNNITEYKQMRIFDQKEKSKITQTSFTW